jgi:hypothetical protein
MPKSQPTEQTSRDRRRTARLIVIAAPVCAALTAVLLALAKAAGLNPREQFVVACVTVAALFSILTVSRQVKGEGLTVLSAALALGPLIVAALAFTGSIDPIAPNGCISAKGRYKVSISGETAVVYSRATPASEPKQLLLQGCLIRFDEYCLGTVHRDILEQQVRDSRWIILPHGQGLVAAGFTVGTIPDVPPSSCPGSVAAPSHVAITKAVLDKHRRRITIVAAAPRAAVIGFAVRAGGTWRRLGWDQTASDGRGKVFAAPKEAVVGSEVVAVACTAFRRPTKATASAPLKLADQPIRHEALALPQPAGARPEAVACDSAVLAGADGA